MARRVFVLALILLLALSFGIYAAEKPIEKKSRLSLDKIKPADESTSYPYSPTPEQRMFFPITGDTAGFTYYDYQHNNSQRRQIANDYLGNLHFSWMNLIEGDMVSNRFIDYNSCCPWLVPGGMHVSPAVRRGGYCGIDILPNSREVIAYHEMGTGSEWGTVLAIEKITPALGGFNRYDMPFDSIAGQPSAELLHWPYVGTAKVKKADTSFIHITTFGTNDEAAYVRCFQDPNGTAGSQNMTCQSPGKTSLTFPPNVRQASKIPYWFPPDVKITYIAAPVVTSPVSQHVAIVWYDQVTGQSFYKGDMYYLESSTNGDDWIAGTNLTPTKITHYEEENWVNYTCYYTEIAAVYDYDSVLHVIWTASPTGSEGEAVTLFHWDKKTNKIRTVGSRSTTADCGAWNYAIAKPTIGVGGHRTPPLADTTYNSLYVVYTGFSGDDTSAGGYANGDLYVKVSKSSGMTWGPEINLTNTKTNGCAAGNCQSEHWASVAERVDSLMYVQYIYDRDAGGIAQTEGSFTNNPVRYLKDPARGVPAVPSEVFAPAAMTSPPRWSTKSGTAVDSMNFDNAGTATLYVQLSGPAYVSIVPNSFNILEAGPTQKVMLTFTPPVATDTFFVDSLKILSNHEVFGGGEVYADTQWLKFHFVVTDTFYYAEYDSCLRGTKLIVSNVGNLADQRDGYMMNFNDHDYLFDYSPAFATDVGGYGKMSFTWVHEKNNYLAENHLKSVNYANLKTKVWYDYAAPSVIDDFDPWEFPAWWWSGWTKYSRIVQYDYDGIHAVLVKNWWKWNRPPKWWPDFAITAPAGGYFGIAADWDVPAEAGRTNKGGLDSTNNLIWLYSDSTGFTDYYGGFGWLRASVNDVPKTKPFAAHVLTNSTQLYPDEGYNDDSLFKYMSKAGWSKEWSGTTPDSAQDLNIVMTFVEELSPDSNTVIAEEHFLLVTDAGLADFTAKAAKLRSAKAGDANADGATSVSDVVYLINYLFKGGPEPWMAYSDANGDGSISVSDVVYLINYLFKGGPAPVLVWDKAPWAIP